MNLTTAYKILVRVTGLQQIAGLTSGLQKVEKQSKRTSGAMGRLKTATGQAMKGLKAMLPVLSVGAFAAVTKSNLDFVDSLGKLSQRTGIAVPMLDKFRKVAEQNDSSIEALADGFQALAVKMSEAQAGEGAAFEAFTKMGISVKDASGQLRSIDSVMLQVADSFHGMADGAEKASLASLIWGEGMGRELIPTLNAGGDAVRRMNTAMSADSVKNATELNTKLTILNQRYKEASLELTEAFLPAMIHLGNAATSAIEAFNSLPGPLQGVLAVLGGLTAVFVILAPAIAATASIISALAAAPILATIAGWLGALVPLIAAIKGVGLAVVAVFSGPVGWVALAIAAGVAIWAFRDKIADAFKFVFEIVETAAKFFYDVFIQPLIDWNLFLFNSFVDIFTKIGEAIKAPFVAAFDFIKGIVNGILKGISFAINSVINNINRVLKLANMVSSKVGIPAMPLIPNVEIPQFATGGVVNGPTLAMVGEGRESEYIIPASKASGFAANWMAGRRGIGAIPGFAEGGVINGGGGGGAGNTTVQVTTGPVMQQDGQNYVTVRDLEGALRQFGKQVYRTQQSYGGRRFQGVTA